VRDVRGIAIQEIEMKEWTTEKPTEIGYHFVFGARGTINVFIRWIVPGENDNLDRYFMKVTFPEPPMN